MKSTKTYTISKEQEKISALSLMQLSDLYDTLETFFAKEQQEIKIYGQETSEIEISLQKNVLFDKDDDAFREYYSILTTTGEIEWLSYNQIEQLSQMLLFFLKNSGLSFTSIPLSSNHTQKNTVPVILEENNVHNSCKILPEDISINKYVHCSNIHPLPTTSYSISGNGQWINNLSFTGIRKFQRKLRSFLLKRI